MATILDKIVARKRQDLAEVRLRIPESELHVRLKRATPARDFGASLNKPGEVRIIAEVKKASPSAGVLREDFDPVAIARTYANHGAACISVLTDEPFFQGKLEDLTAVRQGVDIPVLRKDFIVDSYQLLEARAAGADAVLLIGEILPDPDLGRLIGEADDLGLQSLVELYDADNLPRVVTAGAKIVGINNRDLRSFTTRLEHTLDLAPKLPPHCILVSESGIRNRKDILRLQEAGVHAVLIGETLMRANDIGAKLDELRGIG
jgi:indole-3-glycerol phosphate synthase